MKDISSKHNKSENAVTYGKENQAYDHLFHDDQNIRPGKKNMSEKGNFKRRPTDVMFRNIKMKTQKESKGPQGNLGSHRLSEVYNFQSNFKL